MRRLGPVRLIAGATLLASTIMAGTICAAPANFWITGSNVASPSPVAPTIRRSKDAIDYLYIWARPMTGKELQNVSLNIVADPNQPAVVDFLNSEIKVYNPMVSDPNRLATLHRFQFTFDSSSDPQLASKVTNGAGDRIDGLQAFSIDEADFAGIGPICGAGEAFCTDFGGSDSWLLASVGYKVLATAGSVDIHLQIGSNGINHFDHDTGLTEPTVDTTVLFGVGNTAFNALNNRGASSQDAIAELKIQACAGVAGDYNGNCVVDAADYTVWRDHLNQNYSLLNESMTPNMVTSEDYTVWATSFGTVSGAASGGGSLSIATVPEPAAIVQLAVLAGILFTNRRRTSRS